MKIEFGLKIIDLGLGFGYLGIEGFDKWWYQIWCCYSEDIKFWSSAHQIIEPWGAKDWEQKAE